jgi:hypothetical protein
MAFDRCRGITTGADVIYENATTTLLLAFTEVIMVGRAVCTWPSRGSPGADEVGEHQTG